MKKQIPILLLLVLVFSLINVSASLGCFKQGDNVTIAVPSNASYVTLTNVNYPSPNSTNLLASNINMSKTGMYFNYTVSGTYLFGTYTYGYCDSNGDCYGNSFIINGSGQCVTSEQITLIVLGLIVMFFVCCFFFILSLLFKHPGTKVFLMAISAVTLIIMIGIIAANANIYLAEFPGIVSVYNTYYIVFISLAGTAMAGIILWLVYYSVQMFNKARGRTPDDGD
jgi:hypothetical protein